MIQPHFKIHAFGGRSAHLYIHREGLICSAQLHSFHLQQGCVISFDELVKRDKAKTFTTLQIDTNRGGSFCWNEPERADCCLQFLPWLYFDLTSQRFFVVIIILFPPPVSSRPPPPYGRRKLFRGKKYTPCCILIFREPTAY